MGTPLRNTRHERYAQERAKGLNQMQAAVAAGFSTASSGNMSRVDRRPEIQERVTEIQREKRDRLEGARAAEQQALAADAEDVVVNVAWLIKETVVVLREAQDRGASKDALEAIKLLAQLKGILKSPGAEGKEPTKRRLHAEGSDDADKPDSPRTVNVQILNQILGGMGDDHGDGSAPEPKALPAGQPNALPLVRDGGPLEAVRVLDGLEGGSAPPIPGEAEA